MKTKTTHTPGPWEVSEGRGFRSIKASDGGHVIASDQGEFTGNWEANARLIAAAPDLLEAAKHTLSVLEGTGTKIEGRENFIGIPALRAAIAKAEGK